MPNNTAIKTVGCVGCLWFIFLFALAVTTACFIVWLVWNTVFNPVEVGEYFRSWWAAISGS